MLIRDYLEEFEEINMDKTLTKDEQSRVVQSIYSYIVQLSVARNVEIEVLEDGYLGIEDIDV